MTLQTTLSKNGFYVLLIPIFFVLHGALENFGFVGFRDCFFLLLSYLVAATVIFLLTGLFFRDHRKTSFFTACLLSVYLFFGALDDFLKLHIHFLSRYSVILPLILLSVIALAIYLKKTNSRLLKLTFYLNGLLIIYLIIDVSGFIWKSIHPDPNKLSVYGYDKKNNYLPCDSCSNPDIYFLLFDEYASTISLHDTYHFDNHALDSFLLQRGFSLQRFSHSNYNITPFSMASMLNMNYLNGIKNPDSCTLDEYAKCQNLIRHNKVINFLSSRKYEIVNYSIFDLAGHPTQVESKLLPVKARLITDQTLYNRLVRDIGWHLFYGKFEIPWLTKNGIYYSLNNDRRFLEDVKQETRKKSDNPRFVYAHLSMPHYPYYYDEHGLLRDEKILLTDTDRNHVASYLNYLPYTNKNIRELIDTIQKNTKHSAVIILMGDHGFRTDTHDGIKSHDFKNLNAVYFPDGNYHQLTDSLICVNQFRVIFNILFKQQFPLLQDTTVFLTPKL